MGHFIQSKSSLHVVAQFMFVQHVRLLCQTHTHTHTEINAYPHTRTHSYLCVWHAVRAKRAARLTATFCSLPFYFLPFLTLAQHMQAYTDKGAEGVGEERARGGCTLQACFVVQMFYNGAGIPDIYSIRFSVHAKGIFAIFRVSLFIHSSSSLFFCIFHMQR